MGYELTGFEFLRCSSRIQSRKITKKGMRGILKRTRAPKFEVDRPMPSDIIIAKIKQKIRKGSLPAVVIINFGPALNIKYSVSKLSISNPLH